MPRISLLVMFLTVSNMVFGQWSSDPGENLDVFPEFDISDSYHGFTATGCGDGSVYITAYSKDTTLNISLLNADGFKVWNNGTIKVKHPAPYSIRSFTDNQDNLFLYFPRHYSTIYGFDWVILKISKQGEFCWGENGVNISFPYLRQNSTPHKWAVNENGDVMLFSMQSSTDSDRFYAIYRIDKDGYMSWGKEGLVLDDLEYPVQYVPRNIITTSDGGILILFQKDIGPYHALNYEVYVRKYDQEGRKCWDKDPMIYRGWTPYNSINTYSDQNDGFFFSCGSSIIQHVNKNGSLLWEGEGVNLGDLLYWSPHPKLLGRNNSGDLLLQFQNFYQESSRNLRPFIQIVSESGDVLLPDGGVVVPIPEYQEYDFNYSWRFLSQLKGDSVYYFYSYPIKSVGVIENEIMCYPTTFDQTPLWEKSLTIAQGLESRKSFTATSFVNRQSIIVWISTLENGEVKIKAQNMHTDGTLGNKSTSINAFHQNMNHQVYFDSANRTLVLPRESPIGKYQLVSMTGKVIQEGQVETVIPLSDFKSGLYIVWIWDGVNSVSQKILFQ
ncbi:MAG: T9SS type A sorting domain-containing protein [Bacteroidota bacterium]|nr:T9SS type A sorting domain-containing protein [Bacteroidota bacterium]